jgi:hypothetical protein
MSQPNVHVFEGDTNISIGTDNSNIRNSQNIIIGGNKSESLNAAGNTLQLRLSETINSVIIGNGVVKGVEVGTTTVRTSELTKVPNNCIMLGNDVAIPTEVSGATAGNTNDHLILGSGAFNEGLIEAGGVVNGGVGAASIPIWYNGVRYVLQANEQAAPPAPAPPAPTPP